MCAWEEAPTAKQMKLYQGIGGDNQLSPADFSNQEANAKTWKICKMSHPCYEERCLDVHKENLLFQGGFQMNKPEVAELFCPQMKVEEDSSAYKERVKSAAYVPTFAKLITGLISNLFSQDLSVMEATDHNDSTTEGDEFTDQLRNFYKVFENNADGYGTTLHNFIRDRTTKALIHSFCYFAVDYPKGEAKSLLEQQQLGLDQPRLYKIDTAAVRDWRMQDNSPNDFEWLKLVYTDQIQCTPFDPPMVRYCVKSWLINEEGFASYQCFQSQLYPQGKEPRDKDLLTLIDQGTTSFKRIPVFCFKLDSGISVGAKLAPMAAELFNRSTIENHYTNRACITVPVMYRGELLPGGDGIPSPSQFNMERGNHPRGAVNNNGVVELGSYTSDKLEIVEAKGTALAFIHKQNEDLDEKMHSVVHQMAQSLKQAKSKSGKTAASKQEDRRAMEMLLTSIADEVYSITQLIFTTVANSREENIVWDVKGLSAIAQEDRDELVTEVSLLPTLNFPSLTFMKEYHYRIGSRLIEGTDQRTLQTIRAEIEESLDQVPSYVEKSQQEQQVNNDQSGSAIPARPKNNSISGGNGVSKSSNNNSNGSSGVPSTQSIHINSPGGSDQSPSNTKATGPSGQPLMSSQSHLQTGQHVDSNTIYQQLSEDYKDKDIEWVKHIPWIGPVEVPLSSIDFSNKDNWKASSELDQVQKFADKISQDGFSKPVILANNPSNDNKMMIIDGHHRALAYLQLGQPMTAFVGQVGSDQGPWQKLHSKQTGSKQISNQSEASVTKQAEQQTNKSEK